MSTSKKGANMRKKSAVVFFGILILALSASAGAQPVEFPLQGSQEVPPVTTDGSGHCEAYLNHSQDNYDIECTHDVTDVADPPSPGAHIHRGPAGENGPIIFFFDAATTFSANVNSSTLADQPNPISFEEFLDLLHTGNLYVNVHSPANPGGEIRGQIPPPPSLFFAQFGNGDGFSSDIVLLNSASTGDPITASVNLLDPDGNPLDVGFEGGTSEATIEPREAVTFRTDGQGELVVGSASVTATGPVAGVIRFFAPGSGIAGVQSSTPLSAFLVPVRNEGGIRTALAIRNTSKNAITVFCDFWFGDLHLTTSSEIPVGGRNAQFVEEIFPELKDTDFNGTVLCQAGGGFMAAIALEQGEGVFTTLPVFPLP